MSSDSACHRVSKLFLQDDDDLRGNAFSPLHNSSMQETYKTLQNPGVPGVHAEVSI